MSPFYRVADLGGQAADFTGIRNLLRYNDVINVPAKHFGAYAPTSRLDERTFSANETVYAIVLMRNLSMQLFELLQATGVSLPQRWPLFKEEWLSSFPEYHNANEQQ